MENKYKRTRLACYSAYFTMSSVFCVPPILFTTFRDNYGISYTLLGTLVLINYCTQLLVDIVFSLFSKHFDSKTIVRVMPFVTCLGLLTYAVIPTVLPQYAYVGLLIGTVIFSVAAGLSEVFLSPTIAAIPSDDPKRDMSTLHSLYAFGVFTMVTVSTLYLKLIGQVNWTYLIIGLALLPLVSAFLFMASPMPEMSETNTHHSFESRGKRNMGLFICVLCIFFGSSAENTMSNWVSGYLENALSIDKTVGDILGLSVFAILLGVARILYAKFGKSIMRVLLVGMIGAAACYLAVVITDNTVVGLTACALTGLFTSMLWPGTLIMMEEKIPGVGVSAFALMAASGDLGAAFAPQLMGIVIDKVSENSSELAEKLGVTSDYIGLKAGMLVTAVFPVIGLIIVIIAMKYFGSGKTASVTVQKGEQS